MVGIGAAVMTTLLALVVLWQFRIVLVYVLISLTLTAALSPLVNRLVGRVFVVRMAWILLYLVVLGGFGFLLFLTGESAVKEIQQVTETVSIQGAWRLPQWLNGSAFQLALVTRFPSPSQLFEAVTGDRGQLVLPVILGFTQDIGGIVSGAFIILFLSIYWSSNQIHFERLWLSLLPSDQRTQARRIWRKIETETGVYIRGEVIQSLLIGLLLAPGYWLLGSPSPVSLALVGALACMIPVVGVTVAVIPVLLVGLLTSVQLSLFSVIYTFVVLIALGVWVKPRLFKRRWNNPILTVVLLIALADVFGLVGIIVAPLLSVVCQILWDHLVSHRAVSGAAVQVSDLKARQALVWAEIKAMDEPHPPLVTSSMERLILLIEKAEPVLRVAEPFQKEILPEAGSELFNLPQPVIAHGGLPVSPIIEETGADRTRNV